MNYFYATKDSAFFMQIFLMEVGVFKILKFKLTIQLIIKFYNVKKIMDNISSGYTLYIIQSKKDVR